MLRPSINVPFNMAAIKYKKIITDVNYQNNSLLTARSLGNPFWAETNDSSTYGTDVCK